MGSTRWEGAVKTSPMTARIAKPAQAGSTLRLWILALVVVGVIGLVGWIWVASGMKGLAAHRRALMAQGMPGTLAELNERRKPVPGKPSGVDRLLHLAEAGLEANPDLAGDLSEKPALLSVPLARRKEILRVMRELATQPAGVWSEVNGDPGRLQRGLSRLCEEVQVLARDAATREDWQEVGEGVQALIAIGALLDAEVDDRAMAQIRITAEAMAILDLLPRLSGRPFGETNWARIQDRLTLGEGVPSLQRLDLGAHLSLLDQIEDTPRLLWKQWVYGRDLPCFEWKRVRVLFQIPAIPRRMFEDELERFAMLARPFPECLQGVEDVWVRKMERVQGSMEQAPGIDLAFPRAELGYASRLLRARLGVALCAVERFRLRESGAVPKDLSELTAGPNPLLARVPLDPFNGQPLVLERIEGVYVLRSPSVPPTSIGYWQERANRDRMELRLRMAP